MSQNEFHIAELIAGFISGALDEKELEELSEWRKASKCNETLFQKLRRENFIQTACDNNSKYDRSDAWENVSKRISGHHKTKIFLSILKYAAILLIPLAVITAVMLHSNEEKWNASFEKKMAIANTNIKTIRGAQKSILTLGNNKKINLTNLDHGELFDEDGTIINITSSSIVYSEPKNLFKNNNIRYNTLYVPHGGMYSIVLDDGTKVYLNSLSSLRYPTRFTGEKRVVDLDGEAYFEVAKSEKPFIVQFKSNEVRVLGTTFNISTFKENKIEATLVSGSVELTSWNGNTTLMQPSEKATISLRDGNISVNDVDPRQYTSWLQGKLNFRDERLEDIMNVLSRWYDIDVSYQNESLKDIRIGCNIDRYENIGSVVEILSRTSKIKGYLKGTNLKITYNNH